MSGCCMQSLTTKSDVKMHDYLNVDPLFYIFQILIKQDPYQTFRCERVCVLWRNLTNENILWKQFAHRLKINKDQEPSLKKAIAKVLSESISAVKTEKKLNLLDFEEDREYVFKIYNARILRLVPCTQKTQLEKKLDGLKLEKQNRLKQLKAAFFGHIRLSYIGLSNLSEARKIAVILASDKYLEKRPLEILQKMENEIAVP